jgi:hypothetical protein
LAQFERIDKCEVCGGPVIIRVSEERATIHSMNHWQKLTDLIIQLERANETARKLLEQLDNRKMP